MTIPFQTSHPELADEGFKRFPDLPSYSQSLRVWTAMVNSVGKWCLDHEYGEAQYRRYLDDAAGFFTETQALLNPLASALYDDTEKERLKSQLHPHQQKGDPKEWIWTHRNAQVAVQTGEKGGEYWVVSLDELANTCTDYVKKPWLHVAALERLLVDALIYQEILAYGEAIKPNLLGGGLVGGVLSASRSFGAATGWRYALSAVWELFLLILSLGVAMGAADGHGLWAGALAGLAFWVLLKINRLVSNWHQYYGVMKSLRLLASMQSVSDQLQKYPLSPVDVRAQLRGAADQGAVWPSSIFPLLEIAIARNRVVWE